MSGLTSQFVSALAILGDRQDATLKHAARRCLLDYLGVTLAGAQLLGDSGRRLLQSLDGGGREALAIGYGQQTSLHVAALLNGMSAHVCELDDGARTCSVHPGASIISALLPLAQREGLPMDRVLSAIVVGYEAAIRVGMAIQPSHRNRGYHATGTCGAIGTAMAASFALGHTEAQMQGALAAAATSAAGMLRVIKGGSELKPFNAAQAASAGLTAAFLGGAGFSGPDEVLEGKWGFLTMNSDAPKPDVLRQVGIQAAAIHGIYVKPYAACRHGHAPIEGILRLKAEHGITAESIERIVVSTYHLATEGHDHVEVDGPASAKMSTPYSVAVALIDGQAGISQFSAERVQDPAVIELAKRVQVQLDAALDAQVPVRRPAHLRVSLRDGSVREVQVDLPPGEPEVPLDDEALGRKFLELATWGGLAASDAIALRDRVWSLDSDLSSLFDLLQ